MNSAPPSKVRVKCFYCDLEMLKCSLKKHTSAFHPSEPERYKGQPIHHGIQNFFVPSIQNEEKSVDDEEMDTIDGANNQTIQMDEDSEQLDSNAVRPQCNDDVEIVEFSCSNIQGTDTAEFDELATHTQAAQHEGVKLAKANDEDNLPLSLITHRLVSNPLTKYSSHPENELTKEYFDQKFDKLFSLITSLQEQVSNNSQIVHPIASPSMDNTSSGQHTELKKPTDNASNEEILNSATFQTLHSALVRNCRTVEDILVYFPHFQYHYPNLLTQGNHKPDGLACIFCCDPESSKRAGVITYDFQMGTDFKGAKVPRLFSNLKAHIVAHNQHPEHLSNIEKRKTRLIEDKKAEERRYNVGMNVARSAYKAIYMHSSQSEFESELACDVAKKVDVGDINHSRMLAADMTDYFYQALTTQMKKNFNTPLNGTNEAPPFSVVADKLTPSRRTLQVHGIVAHVNGTLQAFFMDAMPVHVHTGKGIAQSIYENMKTTFSDAEIRKRFVGGAFDGQYFHLGVPQELLELLKIDEAAMNWYAFSWDPAHLIELAEKDTKTVKKPGSGKSIKKTIQVVKTVKGRKKLVNKVVTVKLPSQTSRQINTALWSAEVQATVGKVHQAVGHGKGFQSLLDEAAKATEQASRPISFSDTRFATFSYNVLKNFLHNYPFLLKFHMDNKLPLLSTLKTPLFILRVAGLTDIYLIIQEISRNVQRHDIYPWQVDETILKGESQMNKIVNSLEAETFNFDDPNLSNFGPAANNILQNSSFKSVKLDGLLTTRTNSDDEDGHMSPHYTVFKKSRADLASFATIFCQHLKQRFGRSKQPANLMAAQLFSVKKILIQSPGHIPPVFEKYVKLAQCAEFISSSLDISELKSQYLEFCDIVRTQVNDWKLAKIKYTENSLYDYLLDSSEMLQNCRTMAHLLVGSVSRTHCEAVSEGMGSIVDKHSFQRCSLDPSKLSREVFLKWNGPPPTIACNQLLEMALDMKFGRRSDWRFIRSSREDKITTYVTSKVVDRVSKTMGLVKFD